MGVRVNRVQDAAHRLPESPLLIAPPIFARVANVR
jgi:hypothetical protein